MVLRFKPKFYKDYDKIKNDRAKILLAGILQHIERAKGITEIGALVKLTEYETRYKIRITINKKDDYRV